MRKSMKSLAVISTPLPGVAPALYAADSGQLADAMVDRGTMGQSGMMESGGTAGMMNVMGQMGTVMENRNKEMPGMISDHNCEKPNEQWQNKLLSAPEQKG